MESPMRVLHTVVNMNRGGAETLLMNLYRRINRKTIQFDFLTSREGIFDDEIRKLGGRIYRIPYITDLGPIAYQKALEQFFSSDMKYQIVHSHMDKMGGLILSTAKKSGIPIRIAHSHNTMSEGNKLQQLFKWYVGRRILSDSTHQIACSKDAASWLFSKQAENAYILKNGIETKKFKFCALNRLKKRFELQLREDDFVIGHVGRFNQQKNHNFLLDIFAKVKKVIPNAKLVLVGDGALQGEMKARAEVMKIEKHVLFTGVQEDIASYLHAFDLFLFPSLHEGLGIALIEAQAAGLNCIVSDQIPKEVDLGIGLIHYTPLDDPFEWVKKTIHFQNNRFPRSIYQGKIIEAGYDIQNVTMEMERFYLSLKGGNHENVDGVYANL
ncbi:glycosyltransferase family 1 protein [Pseudalkalibacillus sp. SCS-8]|uniref:glycosyltransferase family 1 protein n=1 Tax=Pseudalkalibacillus nanhaiensis TaxID=3115291 RepID=UPI0032DB271A